MVRKKHKLTTLSSLYIVVALFVAVLSVFSFTFAWYIKSSSSYLDIKFANPIIVEIDSSVQMWDGNAVIEGEAGALLPGNKVYVNLGISMPEGSSNAYVRAKLTVVFEDVYDQNNQLQYWDDFIIRDTMDPNDSWEIVNFGDSEKQDWWYVCCRREGANVIAREVSGGDVVNYANGTVEISTAMTNIFADKKMELVFLVESIQTVGVSDPIMSRVWGMPS